MVIWTWLVAQAMANSCFSPGVSDMIPLQDGAVVPVDLVPTVLTAGGCREDDSTVLDVALIEDASGVEVASAVVDALPARRGIAVPLPATLVPSVTYRLVASSSDGESWSRTFEVADEAASTHEPPTADLVEATWSRETWGVDVAAVVEVYPGEAPDGLGYVQVARGDDPDQVLAVAALDGEERLLLTPLQTRAVVPEQVCWLVTQVDGAGRASEPISVCGDPDRDVGGGCHTNAVVPGAGWLWLGALALGWRRRAG